MAKNIFFHSKLDSRKVVGGTLRTQQLVNFYFILLIRGIYLIGCARISVFIPAAILFYCPRILLFGWLHFFQKWIFWISFSGVPIQFGLEFGLGRSADEDFWSIKK